ncbi:TPA: hypothetical protein ACYLN4_000587 [Burkholderia lata]
MFTVQSLRGMAADHERQYELLLKDFPPGTVHDGRNQARDMMERASFCADWMAQRGIESAHDVGPFMSMSLSRGDKVRLLKGARVFGTGPGIAREGTVNPRNRIITVFSFDRGHIDRYSRGTSETPALVQARVHWVGAGGYWRWADIEGVEMIDAAGAVSA